MKNKSYSKLGDIYDISSLLPSNILLSKKEYKEILQKQNNSTDSFILGHIPIKCVPEKFIDVATLIKEFVQSWHNLIRCVTVPMRLEDESIYNNVVSLFDLITKYHKYPINKFLDNKNTHLPTEVDNYYKSSILGRFFQNKGVVFYSELLKISAVPIVVEDAFTKSIINYYDKLIDDKILRKPTRQELPLILRYLTKQELIKIIEKTLSEKVLPLNKLNNKNKDELIKLISEKKEVVEINLEQYFYLLTDTAQEYKNWLELERLYYKLYTVFNEEFLHTGYSIPRLMKDLIIVNNDYKTAYKLGLIFYRHIEEYKTNPRFHLEWELPRVETQMKKIKRHYKNKQLPEVQLIANDSLN